MKTTSIYTLFFSPTGTSRKIAAAVAQGMAWTEGHTGVRRRQHGTGIPCRANPGSGNHSGDTRACRREQGRNSACTGTKRVTAIDLTHPPGTPPAAGQAVAIFAVPVYGRARGARSPGTPAESAAQPPPAVVLAVYGNRSFGTAVARTRLVRRGTGIRARSGRGIRRRTFVQHARNPDRTGTPRRTGSDCRHGIRGSGARKISKNRAFPRQEPGNGIRHRSNHPGNQNRQHGCSQGPRNGRPCPHRPREAARTAYTAPPEAALHPVRTGLPPPAETQPRRPAARGRCRTLHAMRPLRLCPTQAIARGDELHAAGLDVNSWCVLLRLRTEGFNGFSACNFNIAAGRSRTVLAP